MKPETTGSDLLAAAEQTLVRDVIPALSGDARFKALMTASALRMVMRELVHADALASASQQVEAFGASAAQVASIRAGEHDGDERLHAALMADARVRTQVSNPARLAT